MGTLSERSNHPEEQIVAVSEQMKGIVADIYKVAGSQTSVHLRGETGVGKEVMARLIWRASSRRDAPFIAVNCAAQTETLLESEIFGHERGAFSGAVGKRIGLIEQAEGGTLFLDEIGEISQRFQMLLLRVLQEGEFQRVGGSQRLHANVRLITATNRNLEEAVAHKTFRMDLYYRICVFTILIPPLRERREDIPPLVGCAMRRITNKSSAASVSDLAMAMLCECQWPGNVRELINCVERAVVLAQGGMVEPQHIACLVGRCLSREIWSEQNAAERLPAGVEASPPALRIAQASMDATDSSSSPRIRLIEALEAANGIQARAARLLGLTPRQVGYAIRKYGISRCKL